jgi:hypothetical protein
LKVIDDEVSLTELKTEVTERAHALVNALVHVVCVYHPVAHVDHWLSIQVEDALKGLF